MPYIRHKIIKRMRRLLTCMILFFIISPLLLCAQNSIVKGIVKNQTNAAPLFGVTVVDEANNGTATDSAGNYELKLAHGKHTISFKFISFTEKKADVELKEGETRVLNISLSEASKELGTVVVSASKFEQRIEDVTVSMEVIKPSLVENRNTTSTDEILNQLPGVNVIDGQANIRGGAGWSYGAGSRVMVLVDDLPELSADAGDAKWEFIPLENLSQMEVIKGASSALFGSSALDGVINIRTAYPTDTPQTKINVFSGFYDTPDPANLKWWGNKLQLASGANFFHSRQIKNIDLVIGGNYFKDNGYRQGENEERYRFNGNFRYRFRKIEGLSAGVNFNHAKVQSGLFFIWANDTTGALRPLGGLNPDSTSISLSTVYRTTIDPFVTYVDKKGNSFKLRTRYFNTVNINNTNQNSTGNVYYSELQYQKHFSEQLVITAGAVENYSTVQAQLYGNHNSNNYAFFGQADARWKRFTFSFGARAEHYRTDTIAEKLTPVIRAGINYHLAKETYLRASYGQGYRVPSIAEKFIQTTVGGVTIYPNDSLQPEKGLSSEVGIMQGVKLGSWTGYIDVAGFLTEYNNMTEFVFNQWGPGPYTIIPLYIGVGFRSINTGNTETRGIDISFAGTGEILPGVKANLVAGYTYIDPRQISFNDTYIKEVSSGADSGLIGPKSYLGTDSSTFLKYRYTSLMRADLELTYKRVSFGISMRYNSFMENIDKIFVSKLLGSAQEVVPGLSEYRETHHTGDTVFDLHLGYQATKILKVSFIVKNALNREYMSRPADILPPRSFTIQLSAAF